MGDRQPHVEVDVREHLREVARLPVVGIAVQQQHVDAARLDQPQETGEQQRVAPVQVEVGVAVARVQLQREPAVDAAPEQVAQQGGVGDPRGPCGPAAASIAPAAATVSAAEGGSGAKSKPKR